MKEAEVKEKDGDRRDDHNHGHPHKVKITINGNKYEIDEGTYTVEYLKQLGHVPADEILSQFQHGQLIDLDDNGRVEIRGAEKFASHVKSSGAS